MSKYSVVDARLKHPTSIILSGASNCGKSFLTFKIISLRKTLFNPPIQHVTYFYTVYQKIFDDYAHDVAFISRLEDFIPSGENTLLILDDCLDILSEKIASYFTRGRHYNVTTIFQTQNIFHKSPHMRTITANCQNFIIFKSPKAYFQLSHLIRQIYTRDKGRSVLASFEDSTKQPFSYFWIDLAPQTPEYLRLKTDFLNAASSNTISAAVYKV